jgi:hypothetical protein
MKHFLRNPSSPPIKEGSFLLIINNTQEKSTRAREEQHHSWA